MLCDAQVLQDAILLYLDSIPKQSSKYRAGEFQIINGPKANKKSDDQERIQKSGRVFDPYTDEYGDQHGARWPGNSDCEHRADEIQRFQIQTVPPEHVVVNIAPGLFLQKATTSEPLNDQRMKVIVTFRISSNKPNGQELIDSFCNKALQQYKTEQAEKKDDSRYLYTPLFASKTSSSSSNDAPPPYGAPQGAPSMLYKRYKLSEDKTFTTFFHPDKEPLLRLLEEFVSKTGKFAIPGYPHKLGLLLHGPPGTGKTSLIKAMANYTKRNITFIPLARVSTNQELMDLLFDQTCRVEGDDWIYNMPFRRTIFVMEDVDAAIDKVHRRKEDEGDSEGCSSSISDTDNEEKEVNERKRLMDQLVKEIGKGLISKSDIASGSDQLNLAGILNVLDGVVDCPERIIVMTTNHPEKLDPALIRPGRINKKLYMGPLRVEEAVLMVENYVGPFTEIDKQAFEAVFPAGEISPAALESLCADCSSVQDILDTFSGSDGA